MTMFLHILGIAGMTLLYALLTILILVIIVLLIPIRYKADASFRESVFYFKFSASFLSFVLRFKGEYDKEFKYSLRCFGFLVKNKKNKTDKKEKAAKQEADVLNSEEASDIPANFESEDNEDDLNHKLISKDIENNSSKADSNEKVQRQKENEKNDSKHSNKSSNYDKIKKKIDVIKSERFKSAFSLCKRKILRLFKHILPRNWKIKGCMGFEDPSVTGKILAFNGALFPWIYKHVDIKGDFENSRIDISGYFKGHIVLIKLIVICLSAYLNKDVRKIIKLLGED